MTHKVRLTANVTFFLKRSAGCRGFESRRAHPNMDYKLKSIWFRILMKVIKFEDKLIPLILNGEKTTTWRCFDNRNLKAGDDISLCNNGGEEFAKGVITSVRETTFRNLL